MGTSDQELTGRVAIVTGAGAGIGAGIAAMLAEAGAAVAIADIDGESAASTAKVIENRGGWAITVTADVSDARDIDTMVRQTVKDLGRVDILVNNAGIATTELVEDLDEEKWRSVRRLPKVGRSLGAVPKPCGFGSANPALVTVAAPADAGGLLANPGSDRCTVCGISP